MATFSDMGVQLVEKEDDAAEEAEGNENAGGNIADDDTGRTDDPVRMYLREMGAVELLSREGEIAIAKRIEAGREMMIVASVNPRLLSNLLSLGIKPLKKAISFFVRLLIWLRHIMPALMMKKLKMRKKMNPQEKYPKRNLIQKMKPLKSEDDTEADEEAAVSLTAMEEELAPQVYGIFGNIKKTYKKMQKAQAERLEALQKGKEPGDAVNKKYNKAKEEMVELMNEVKLHNARIEQLIDRLYGTNRELVTLEGKLMRLAVNCKVKRESFWKNITDQNWIQHG